MRSGCHASLPPLDCFGHGFVEIKRTSWLDGPFLQPGKHSQCYLEKSCSGVLADHLAPLRMSVDVLWVKCCECLVARSIRVEGMAMEGPQPSTGAAPQKVYTTDEWGYFKDFVENLEDDLLDLRETQARGEALPKCCGLWMRLPAPGLAAAAAKQCEKRMQTRSH